MVRRPDPAGRNFPHTPMKWSLRLGRFFGIDFYLHVTFLLFLGWIWWSTKEQGPLAFGFFILAFTCVGLHEYGHALMARKFGVGTRDITLLPIGGVARLERMPEKPGQEFLVAIAGPAVNAVIALLLFLVCRGLGIPVTVPDHDLYMSRTDLLLTLMWWNVVMILFNMLPAFPMDGGRVLRALLAMKFDYAKATRAAAVVGKGMALLFTWFALFKMGSPLLIIIAVFVWMGASEEAASADERSALAGVRVRDAMMVEFRSLTPEHTAAAVAQFTLQGWQADFPVMQDDQVVGIVAQHDLLGALSRDHAQPVGQFMRREVVFCDPGEPLRDVLERMKEAGQPLMPVMRDGRLAGLVTTENSLEFILFRRALSAARPVA
jgi:Zn-dependent protease/predicted transcriptional regulator